MTPYGWTQIALTLLIALAISVPAGRYLAAVFTERKTRLDGLFDPLDHVLYRLIGQECVRQPMGWKTYTLHMLATNLGMAVIVYLVLVFQDRLPLNPLRFSGMEPLQAFNTTVSFVTNTDWQGYGGETTLSILSQMIAITFAMFTSAATGFVIAMAFIRAFVVKDGGADLGNFYRDLIRLLTRVLLLPAIVVALFCVWQGSPQTLRASVVARPLQGGEQTISLGPVAALESIKHFGTNGGGFFSANASHPYENPTPLTSLVLILLMTSLPSALVVCFGVMIGRHRQAWIVYAVMGSLLIGFLPMSIVPEQWGTPMLSGAGTETAATATQPGGNMEGKEVRFGIVQSGLFAAVTTLFTTGSVNAMHDSFTPLGGMGPLIGMMLQCVFGGKGIGFLNALVYGLVAVFVAGLMVGHTPEFLGKKIEKPEIIMVSLALVIHPLAILAPSAWSMVHPYGLSSLNNAAMHGYSEVLYAFASAAANNGSAFAGLDANTPWYNVALGVVILIGRYPPIIFMMAVAGSVARKTTIPVTVGTLRTDTLKFGAFWLGVILILGALQFFPALVLGPIAEFFASRSGVVF